MSENQKSENPIPDTPAFPVVPSREMWDLGIQISNGMSLRQYYAGQALASVDAHSFKDHKCVAKFCFEVADAMMREAAK